jgi:hypothetical protein
MAKLQIRVGFELRAVVLVMVCVAGLTVAAKGQSGTSSAISGTLTDTTGGLIPNAVVTATETNTKAIRTGRTDASGRYLFSLVNTRSRYGSQASRLPLPNQYRSR